MPNTFKTSVLDPLKKRTGKRIKLPKQEGIAWDYVEDAEHREVQLTVAADVLCGDLRKEGPSSPVFALCLAAALADGDGLPVRAAVEVTGPIPAKSGLGYKTSSELLQFRRSAFLMHTLAQLVPDRFALTIPEGSAWEWPEWSWFSIEGYRKNKDRPDNGRARLAYELEVGPELFSSFGTSMEPIRRFQGLLPVIVHTQEVTKDSHWTVGGKTGVDVWAASADHRRLHLFELDQGSRTQVGSLASAIANVATLEYVFDGNGHFSTEANGLAAVRRARRMVMWLSADSYHPLVFDEATGESTVLSWLNRGLRRRNFLFGVLPWKGDVTAPKFNFAARWGGGRKYAALS